MKLSWFVGMFTLLIAVQVEAQSRKHQYRKDRYFFGVTMGSGFTQPIIQERFSLLETTPQSANENFDKKYGNLFQHAGGIYGLHFSFAFTKLFSVVSQPCFQTQRYNYMNNYHWSDTITGGEVYKEFLHRQKINNIRIPILARMDFSARRWSPFIQAGLSADIAYFASKQIYTDNQVDRSVDRKTAVSSNVSEMTAHLNRFNVYAVGGAGISYYREQFAISLSGNVRYGIRTTIDPFERYSDYTGMASEYLDVQDKFNLLTMDIMLTLMVPIHKKW